MKFLCNARLSEHRFKTPEGYLVCTDAILARTGKQTYRKNEVFADADDDSEIEVDRKPEEVFSEATLASFEGKPVTVEHPDEDVNVNNYKEYAVGFVRNIRKGQVNGQDVMLGDIFITDKQTIEEIENGEHTDLSCGYDCDIVDEENPQQRNIRGNHVALCQQGRAGIARLVDSKDKDMKSTMSVVKNFSKPVQHELRQYNSIKDARTKSEILKEIDEVERAIDYYDDHNNPWKVSELQKKLDELHRELKNTKDSIVDDIIKAQKMVDDDMKYNGEISEETIQFLEKTGLKVVEKNGKQIVTDSIINNKEIRKMNDEIEVTHEDGREEPKYVMQSDLDKYLFFYIGEKFAMKEGNWSYTKYKMNGRTPESLKTELAANGWHEVTRGPAPFIDSVKDAVNPDDIVDYISDEPVVMYTGKKLINAITSKFPNATLTNIAEALQYTIDKYMYKSLNEVKNDLRNKYGLHDSVKDAYNRFERENDVEYLKESLSEMRKYERNWSYLSAREKREISPENGLKELKQNITWAEQRLQQLQSKNDSIKDATTAEIIEKLRSISIPDEQRWTLTSGKGWQIDIQNFGMATKEDIMKYPHVSPKLSSMAEARLWYDGKFITKFEGPINVVKDQVIKYLQSHTQDSLKKYEISYKDSKGNNCIQIVKAKSLQEAIKKVNGR